MTLKEKVQALCDEVIRLRTLNAALAADDKADDEMIASLTAEKEATEVKYQEAVAAQAAANVSLGEATEAATLIDAVLSLSTPVSLEGVVMPSESVQMESMIDGVMAPSEVAPVSTEGGMTEANFLG